MRKRLNKGTTLDKCTPECIYTNLLESYMIISFAFRIFILQLFFSFAQTQKSLIQTEIH